MNAYSSVLTIVIVRVHCSSGYYYFQQDIHRDKVAFIVYIEVTRGFLHVFLYQLHHV